VKTLTIRVDHVSPPIPIRDLDYLAYLGDGDEDSKTASGTTAMEAVENLVATLDEGDFDEPDND
jgi:hypothetical protein